MQMARQGGNLSKDTDFCVEITVQKFCTGGVSFFHAKMGDACVHKFFPVSLVSHTGIEL
jgi:hypothetical protein